MPKSAGKPGTGKSQRIEMRISEGLQLALEGYCERNLVTVAEAATQAIKNFIGFNSETPVRRQITEDSDEKPKRLEIRIHPKLKQSLVEFCKVHDEASISSVVTNAIYKYLKLEQN